jgi:hypothetical protein
MLRNEWAVPSSEVWSHISSLPVIITGYPEVETDGRGGATMILDLAGRNGSGLCGDATTLSDSRVVVSMP